MSSAHGAILQIRGAPQSEEESDSGAKDSEYRQVAYRQAFDRGHLTSWRSVAEAEGLHTVMVTPERAKRNCRCQLEARQQQRLG
jgi:hypothetical protein